MEKRTDGQTNKRTFGQTDKLSDSLEIHKTTTKRREIEPWTRHVDARTNGQNHEAITVLQKRFTTTSTDQHDLAVRFTQSKIRDIEIHGNKAGYTATLVACEWAGAVTEKITGVFGQKQ